MDASLPSGRGTRTPRQAKNGFHCVEAIVLAHTSFELGDGSGAEDRSRTDDLLIKNQMAYQWTVTAKSATFT